MKNTVQFLDAVKKKHGLPSDYALAGTLGLSRAAISKFRVGKDCLGDETACKVAELLDLDPGYVMACIAAERAKIPAVKAAWKHTAEALFGLAAVLAIVAILPTATAYIPTNSPFNVALRSFDNSTFMAHGIYIMRVLELYAPHLMGAFLLAVLCFPGKNRRLFDSFRMNAAIRAFRRSAADVGRN